jgi:hypothetical protein
MATKRKSGVDPVLAELNGGVKPVAALPSGDSVVSMIGKLDTLAHDTGSIAVAIATAILTAEKAPTGLSAERAAALAVEFVKSKGIAEPTTPEQRKSSSYGTLVSVWTTRLRTLHVLGEFYTAHTSAQVAANVEPHKRGCGWSALTTYARKWLDAEGKVSATEIVQRATAKRDAAAAMREGLTPVQKAGAKLYGIVADTDLAIAFRKELMDMCARHGVPLTDPKLLKG